MIKFLVMLTVLIVLIIVFSFLIIQSEKSALEREIEETKEKIKLGRLQ